MKIKQITILQLLKNRIERVVSPALSEVETHLFSNFSKTLLILLLVNLLLIDCSSRVGDFTAISTRNSNVKNWKRTADRVEGYSCSWWFFFIPIKSWDMKDAIEDAVDISNKSTKSKGLQAEALLDVKLSSSWFTSIIVTRTCLYAEGVPADSWYKTEEREDQIKK